MDTICLYLTDNKNKSILAFGLEDCIEYDKKTRIEELQKFLDTHKKEYRLGYFSYDLFTQSESKRNKTNRIHFPKFGFFIPKYIIDCTHSDDLKFLKGKRDEFSSAFIHDFFSQQNINVQNNIQLQGNLKKEEYLENVKFLQRKIKNQEVEGITYCQDFYAEKIEIQPLATYFQLNKLAKAPYAAYLQWKDKFLLSASPEQFIKKEGNTLMSKPIKGTAKRGKTKEEDELIKYQLQNSVKEIAENSMVAEMVLKELEKIAEPGTAKIEELHQLYTFETVHQLISSVSCTLKEGINFTEILQNLFPMGSMTGVPKEKSLEILEEIEDFERGLYSGSVGYFDPEDNFDFNVIIRSILYNTSTKSLSCPVGGAITIHSVPEQEYEECLVKIDALQKVLQTDE